MKLSGDSPSRAEFKEKTDLHRQDMRGLATDMNDPVEDIETLSGVQERLNDKGDAETIELIENEVEGAKDESDETFEREAGELNEVRSETQEDATELDERSDLTSGDAEELQRAADVLHGARVKEAADRSSEEALRSAEFLGELARESHADVEENEQVEDDYRRRLDQARRR